MLDVRWSMLNLRQTFGDEFRFLFILFHPSYNFTPRRCRVLLPQNALEFRMTPKDRIYQKTLIERE